MVVCVQSLTCFELEIKLQSKLPPPLEIRNLAFDSELPYARILTPKNYGMVEILTGTYSDGFVAARQL